ncbi:hypothetical protein D9611_010133 [Ephemerocybe angulata]|uniref:Uncharacterized protein n=1 Tax=Ephemerocybe angulata TaxID=980116 RepID=A0A8H5AZ05_9AGAR|nr:hypothetical protein D9611_010133 [Tulosesus angulatus]
MVFITKHVAVAALLVAPVIAAPLSQTVEDLERRGDVELEERGMKTNLAAGAVGGYFIGKLWHKFRHRNDNKDAPNDAPVEARDLVDYLFESREWDGELEERGVKTNIAAGAVGGYFIGKLWHKFRHGNDNKDAPNDAPVEARDLVDFIYARAVLNRARALERRNALENMIDELD